MPPMRTGVEPRWTQRVPNAQHRYNAAFDDDDRRLRRAPSRITFDVASVAEFVEFRLADGANGFP